MYKLLKLNIRRKGKRRLPVRILKPLAAVQQINLSWSMDFMINNYDRPHDALDGCSPMETMAVDSWRTRSEFPRNPKQDTTTITANLD
ncbi:MAG: hypothetical protein WKF87_09280 [Chryseolinea sp.]